jgi:hypothetical protein
MTTVKEQKRKTITLVTQNYMGYITQSMMSPCHHGMAHPQVLDGGIGFQYGGEL